MSKVASNKVPPRFENDTEYEAWKKDNEIWGLLTDLDASKQALAIHLGLTGRTRMASSEISVAELSKPTGVATLIAKLDGLFLQDKGRRQFTAFHKLYNLRRGEGVKISDFIVEFEHEYYSFTKQDMKLPDTIIAYMLLASCDLSQKDVQVVMSGVSDVSYENMKSALKRIFGGGMTENNCNRQEIKSEPLFQCNDDGENYVDDVFYVRGRGKKNNFRGGA